MGVVHGPRLQRLPARSPLGPARALVLAAAAALGTMVAGTAAAEPPAIQLNQLGYLPGAAKWAAVPARPALRGEQRFRIVEADSGREVFSALLADEALWAPAQQSLRLADFSALRSAGRYRLQVDGQADADLRIADAAFAALNAAALKAFYFNRAGIALSPALAGPWARPAGHADARALVHASAASPERPAGTAVQVPKGWYDAGDYNLYIVNSGITVYTLLAAWEHFPEVFRAQRVGLPESGNGLPDLLNEVLWNLEWMLAMQDPHDGGVYHKLSSPSFDGAVLPHQSTGPRYLVQKTTAAALDFAAVTAQASRVFAAFEAQRPGLAARLLAASRAAWAWAAANPSVLYRQPADIHTGEYGDSQLDDERAWAAAELYISTGEAAFRTALQPERVPVEVPGWGNVHGLAWTSLAQHRARLPAADRALAEARIRSLGEQLAAQWQVSSYRLALQAADIHWGSNATVLNQALMLIQAYRLDGQRRHLDAAQAALDYVLGRNPLGLSMVTGFGRRSPQHPHHRPSMARPDLPPVPGFIVGGPNPGQQDAAHCPVAYPSRAPALSYIDHACSYASNEVAINWNAPLVYVSAALQALTPAAP